MSSKSGNYHQTSRNWLSEHQKVLSGSGMMFLGCFEHTELKPGYEKDPDAENMEL
jgi:hypothetical protein